MQITLLLLLLLLHCYGYTTTGAVTCMVYSVHVCVQCTSVCTGYTDNTEPYRKVHSYVSLPNNDT